MVQGKPFALQLPSSSLPRDRTPYSRESAPEPEGQNGAWEGLIPRFPVWGTQFLRKEYLVRSILKDILFIAIVTKYARATLIYLFKSA